MPNTPSNPVGKPLRFKTVEELQAAIDDYFDYCDNRLVRGWDEKKGTEFSYISPAPYTMSGLARHIGIDRKSLLNYSNREQYFPTIQAAREKVHEDVETRLMEKQATGAIFNLKNNFGWKDENKTDVTSGGKPVVMVAPTALVDKYGISQDAGNSSQE